MRQVLTELDFMGVTVGRPATFDDWLSVSQSGGVRKFSPHVLHAARYQTALASSFSLWHKPWRLPLLVGGAVPLVNHSTVWLQPGPEMGQNMLRCIRWARLEMQRQKKMAVNQCLQMEVQHGHKPGQRIADLIGFKRISINQIEIWEM